MTSPQRHRVWKGTVALAALAVSTAACSVKPAGPPERGLPDPAFSPIAAGNVNLLTGDKVAGYTFPSVLNSQLRSLGDMMVCATGTTRPVTVVGVTAWHATDERVTAFATRDNPFLHHPIGTALGFNVGPLKRFGFDPVGPQYIKPCEGPQLLRPTELAVTTQREGSGTGLGKRSA